MTHSVFCLRRPERNTHHARSHPPALALTALCLSAAQPATHAQGLTLNSGNAVTVNSAGTHGTYQGAPINNSTTQYGGVQTNGTSTFTLGTGGNVFGNGTALYTLGTGLVTVTGGTISATNAPGLYAFALYTQGAGLAAVTGGTFTTFGQLGYGLFATGGTIDLFGTSFSYTVGNVTTTITTGTLPSGDAMGTLRGIPLDGEALTTSFRNSGTIEVNVGTPPAFTPEPSQTAALGIGILGLSSLALSARRRRAA